MTNTTIPPFSFPAVARKKVTADFDGGRLTSDGGVMLLAMAERHLGIADRIAGAFSDRRDPSRITHRLADMIRARTFAIACGYEDADDLDSLRTDPAFKLACGRLPETGADLCSQPTLSRLENAPSLKDAIRLTYALVDQWIASYKREPASVVLDIDDTCDVHSCTVVARPEEIVLSAVPMLLRPHRESPRRALQRQRIMPKRAAQFARKSPLGRSKSTKSTTSNSLQRHGLRASQHSSRATPCMRSSRLAGRSILSRTQLDQVLYRSALYFFRLLPSWNQATVFSIARANPSRPP